MRALALAAALLLLPAPAAANQGDLFGFGPRTATAGAGSLSGDNAYAAYDNPAAMGLQEFDQLSVSLQLGYLQLADWGYVAMDTDLDGQIEPRLEDRDGEVAIIDQRDARSSGVRYDAPHSIQVGLVKSLSPWLRLGAAVSLPLNRVVRIHQHDPYLPYYTRWHTRPQRFSAYAGASLRPVRGLHFGGGVAVLAQASLSMLVDLDVVMSQEDGDQPPGVDFTVNPAEIDLDVRLRVAPVAGLLIDFELFSEKLRGLRLGATFRGPIHVRVDPTYLGLNLNVESRVPDLEALVGLMRTDIFFQIVDFYTPMQVVIAAAWDRGPFAAYLDLKWAQWSRLIPSVARVDEDQTNVQINFTELSPGARNSREVPDGMFGDTWSIRAGFEVRPRPWTLRGPMRELGLLVRAGYGYEPSFVADQTGRTNILDNNLHIIGAGLGLQTHDPFGWLAGPISLDLSFQLQLLQNRVHTKDLEIEGSTRPAGYPMGQLADGSAGQGEIQSGGLVFLGGASVAIRF